MHVKFVVVSALVIGSLPGCASTDTRVVSEADGGAEHSEDTVRKIDATVPTRRLVGAYRFSDGFWSWEIHLMHGGDYAVFSISDILEEGDDGELRRGVSRVGRGRWKTENNSVVFRREDSTNHVWTVVTVGGADGLMQPLPFREFRRVYVRTRRPTVNPKEPNQQG